MEAINLKDYPWEVFLGRRVLVVCRSGDEFIGFVFKARDGVLRLDIDWRKRGTEKKGKSLRQRSIAVPLTNVAWVEETDYAED